MLKKLSLAVLLTAPTFIPLVQLPVHAQQQQQTPLRVVIIPFRNLSEKAEDQWLGNSFAESLTMGLLKVKALQVIERGQLDAIVKEQNMGQSARVDEQSAPRLGKLLGAKLVVMGSFQKVGDQLQANVRFVDAETGEVDPNRFAQIQGPFNTIFDLQADLAKQLVNQLQVQAKPDEIREMKAVFTATQSPEAYRHYIEGQTLLRQGTTRHLAEAISAFQKALKEDPNYALAYAGLAESYATRADFSKQLRVLPGAIPGPNDEALARQAATKALSLNRDLPEVMRALAKLDWNDGKRKQAMQTLILAIQKSPQNTESLITYIGFRFQEAGLNLQASQLQQELTQLGANLNDPWLQLELAAVGLGNEAIRPASQRNLGWIKTLLNQAQQQLPDHSGICLLLMTVALIEEDPAAQAKWYQRTLALSQDNPNMLAQLATQKLGQGELEQAQELINQAQQIEPQNLIVSMLRANILFSRGEQKQAEALYEQLESRTDKSELIPFLRGINYFVIDDLEKAETYLTQAYQRSQALEQTMTSSSLTFYLALTYFIREKYDQAIPLFQALREDPLFYSQAYQFLAKSYRAQTQYQDALAAYTSYLSIHPEMKDEPNIQSTYRMYHLLVAHLKEPKNLAVLIDLGQTFTDLEEYSEADEYLTQALEIDGENPFLWSRIGYLQVLREEWADAKSSLGVALKHQPDDLKSWFNLAVVLQHQGDKKGMQAALKQVLRLQPDHAQALEMLKN